LRLGGKKPRFLTLDATIIPIEEIRTESKTRQVRHPIQIQHAIVMNTWNNHSISRLDVLHRFAHFLNNTYALMS
jgi:hypothetical protein